MITKQRYVEYLISTPVNFTCTNLADYMDTTSHDVISDYLRREKYTARHLWELAEPLINDGSEAYLIVDDSVQDKRHSYSSPSHCLIFYFNKLFFNHSH